MADVPDTRPGHRRLPDGREVHGHPDAAAVATAAAALVAAALRDAVAARGVATLALAGGSTPRALHERLASEHRHDVPWDRTTIVFGDERCVPPDHDASNYRMARTSLLDHVPIAPARVHRVQGELPPAAAAADYERTLRQALAPDAPHLDVVLLGVGADGHTASLFPGDPALDERARWAVAVTAPDYVDEPRDRVTLTLPVLGGAGLVIVLATGAGKRDAVRAALAGTDTLPAARVRGRGRTCWLLDAAAAGGAG